MRQPERRQDARGHEYRVDGIVGERLTGEVKTIIEGHWTYGCKAGIISPEPDALYHLPVRGDLTVRVPRYRNLTAHELSEDAPFTSVEIAYDTLDIYYFSLTGPHLLDPIVVPFVYNPRELKWIVLGF